MVTEQPVEVHDRQHGIEVTVDFIGSQIRHVMETLEHLMVRMDRRDVNGWTHLETKLRHDLVELLVRPLNNFDGAVTAAGFCTAKPGEFPVNERDAIERIVPALCNVCELRTLGKVELTLRDTYTKKETAQRIFAGRIRRGQIESLGAAFDDLRSAGLH